MSRRPLRFGLASAFAESRAEWLEQARRAEDEGFDVFLVADHLGALNPAAAMQSVAEHTGLRVGQYVLNNDFRHPAIVAQECATLDLLTDGRLEVGLGAGWNRPEYEETGIRFDRPGVRIRRLEESVQILKRLFAGETVDFEGEFYTFAGHALEPLPPQGASMPVAIGGNGDRVLAVAARHASIVGFTGASLRDDGPDLRHFTWEGLADRVLHVRNAAGDRADELELNVLFQRVEIGPSAEAIAERLASAEGAQLTSEQMLDSPFMHFGPVEEVVERLHRLVEEIGITYFTVFGRRSEGFAAVLDRMR